ncbi:MAG: tetratricopeptide repeat protein [Candidatus Omnitrophica bacterium]|nr:tetratricopeptide repeat protein [Candidatus Omnitrophota bacterium]
MKKIILTALLGLFIAGCANDQYAIEKQYWRIRIQAEKIFKNPSGSPPNELERVVNIIKGFIKKYPENNLATEAEFNIARLYIAKEAYDKSREQLNTIISKYNKSEAICSEAIFLIGNSYQIQDQWNPALEQYKKIIQEYPTTLRGIDIPIYIAQYYKSKYQPDNMIAAYKEAISHYRALSDKYPDSQLAYGADKLVAGCYMALKDWQGAIDAFNNIITKYKGKVSTDEALMNIALIYKQEIKDEVKAREILQQFITDYPKSRFIKTATAMLEERKEK